MFSVTKTQSAGFISCLEHCATRVLHCFIVTRAAIEVEIFYEQMTEALKKYREDICFIIGDFNAEVGKTAASEANGCLRLEERNERGERLVQFCREQRYVITNTMFEHHKRRLVTWISPGGYLNQIDY